MLKIFLFLFFLVSCETVSQERKPLHFDNSNYRRELTFTVNDKEIVGYGMADFSDSGYTIKADVPSDIFRGFIRSCNGTKSLEINKEGLFKNKRRFETVIPNLGDMFDESCLVEIYLFSGEGEHVFGIFDKKGKEDLLFTSYCNYKETKSEGSDICHSTVGDYYILKFDGDVKFFHVDKCAEPERISFGQYQILISKDPCSYSILGPKNEKIGRISVTGWNDIFMREVF